MCRQFVQCSGESILVTGMTFGEGGASAVAVSAFVVAYLSSVALWWTYFDQTEGLAREVITPSENPGPTILSDYTYSHVPMIAGIIAVAAADELIVPHSGVQGTLASVALTLGERGFSWPGRYCSGGPCHGCRPGRTRRVDRVGTGRLRDTSARPQRRSGLDRRSRDVGDPWLPSTYALATPVYPVSAGCSPSYSNGQDYSPAFLIGDLSEVRMYRVLGSR
jgi:hypothetical protein